MSRIIVVTSGKGGVGKSTLVSNLGSELSKENKVVLIDADLGLKNLDCILGLENRVVFDIEDVIENRAELMQALVNDKKKENLYILPACRNLDVTKVDFKYMEKIVLELQDKFDYIIIDCPAGIDGGFKRAVECGQEHIVVTTPHLSALRDADKVINALCVNLSVKPYVIINRARGDLMIDGKMLSVSTISSYLSGKIIGVVPEDDNVAVQMYRGVACDNSSISYSSIEMIAKSIVKGNEQVFDCTKKYKGIIGSIRKRLKRSV